MSDLSQDGQLDLVASLREHRVMAVIRGRDAAASVRAGIALVEEGIPLVEVSLSGDTAVGVIERIAAEAPHALVGAGTVLTPDDVKQVQQAGAQFVVTPALTPSVQEAVRCNLPVLSGAMTPSEVLTAVALGASAVKIFPASVIGGPAYITALRAPLPDVPLVAVGGVAIDQASTYLRVGAVAVGLGSPLVGDAADGGDLEGLRRRVSRLLRALDADRRGP